MRAVDEDIRAAALSAGRHIAVAVEIAAKSDGEYVTKQILKSEIEYIKITVGGDSDGVTIGKTYCAKLVLKIPRYIDIAETDRLIVRVGYDTGAETSTGKMPLGWFYVDNIAINGYVATVTAFDKMLRGSKNYISTLDYPAVLPNVLDEVCAQMGLSLDSSVTVPEYMINTPPIRGKDNDGNTLYYSKRQMLGFIGSLMGGNWFINGGGHLDISKIADSVDTISSDNVFESDINSDVFTVTGISWNTGSQTLKRQDVDARGVIEFFNPLNVIEEPIIAALEMALVGKSYYGGKIKRQGAGWHEIGDIVNVPIDKNGNTKAILLTGIERVFENGGYTETWQSCAQTESEANYTVDSGADVSGTSEAEYFPLSEYEYLTDLSVRYNGVTYTAEKDDTTGLISRIYDDSDNEFEPTINKGITDITMHNAAFLAVAMLSGLGNSTIMPVTAGLVGYFDYKRQCTAALWTNRLGGDNIPITGSAAVNADCLQMPNQTYGMFKMPYQDNGNFVLYAVVKVDYDGTLNQHDCAIGSSNGDNIGSWRAISADGYSADEHFRCWFCDTYGGGIGTELSDGSSVKSYDKYNVITLIQSSGKLLMYINGIKSADSPSVTEKYGDFWGVNCLANSSGGANRFSNTTGYFKMLAIGRTPHTAEQIATNAAWLKKYYGL